jgi:hypothetical protein
MPVILQLREPAPSICIHFRSREANSFRHAFQGRRQNSVEKLWKTRQARRWPTQARADPASAAACTRLLRRSSRSPQRRFCGDFRDRSLDRVTSRLTPVSAASFPILAVQRAVLHCLGDVFSLDLLAAAQVGDGPTLLTNRSPVGPVTQAQSPPFRGRSPARHDENAAACRRK